jgi:hypothetical protein
MRHFLHSIILCLLCLFHVNETRAWILGQDGIKQHPRLLPLYGSSRLTSLPSRAEGPHLLSITPVAKESRAKTKSVDDSRWDVTFDRLVRYSEKHNDTRLQNTFNDGGSPHLGSWVQYQRRKIRNGSIKRVRFDRLKSLGFEWEKEKTQQNHDSWNTTFERLV